jgi:hypothetical protein
MFFQITSPQTDQPYRQRAESTISMLGKPGAVHEGIASADLQNPSDALEILAQVADRADDGESSGSGQQTPGQPKNSRVQPRGQDISSQKMDDYWSYKPIQDGIISPEMVYSLFQRSVSRLVSTRAWLTSTATRNSFTPSSR